MRTCRWHILVNTASIPGGQRRSALRYTESATKPETQRKSPAMGTARPVVTGARPGLAAERAGDRSTRSLRPVSSWQTPLSPNVIVSGEEQAAAVEPGRLYLTSDRRRAPAYALRRDPRPASLSRVTGSVRRAHGQECQRHGNPDRPYPRHELRRAWADTGVVSAGQLSREEILALLARQSGRPAVSGSACGRKTARNL